MADSTLGQFEGTVVRSVVLHNLSAKARGGVVCCHGGLVVLVVPDLLLLLHLMASGVLGRDTV